MKITKLKGLVAAPFTPFDSSGDLQLGTIERYAAHLVGNGVEGAFICGTTGEGVLMTEQERCQLAERWIDVAKGSLRVVVHVGHSCQRSSVQLAAHAAKIGAGAVAAMSPTFFKPAGVSQLIDFLEPIAAAAASLPFYYYNIPSMTGVNLSNVEFLEQARGRIPNLRGIKFTHSDMMEYARCKQVAGGMFDIAWGVDEMLLGALAVGATSAVGSTYNYAAPLYLKMIRAFQNNDFDLARDCTNKSVEMIAPLLKYGGLRVGKATMAMIGLDCGPTRSPIAPLSAVELAAVRQAYEAIGFFEWARPSKSSAANSAVSV